MKRLFPYITFACLIFFASTSSLTGIAAVCSNHNGKVSEIKCDKDDTECQTKETEVIDINEAIKS